MLFYYQKFAFWFGQHRIRLRWRRERYGFHMLNLLWRGRRCGAASGHRATFTPSVGTTGRYDSNGTARFTSPANVYPSPHSITFGWRMYDQQRASPSAWRRSRHFGISRLFLLLWRLATIYLLNMSPVGVTFINRCGGVHATLPPAQRGSGFVDGDSSLTALRLRTSSAARVCGKLSGRRGCQGCRVPFFIALAMGVPYTWRHALLFMSIQHWLSWNMIGCAWDATCLLASRPRGVLPPRWTLKPCCPHPIQSFGWAPVFAPERAKTTCLACWLLVLPAAHTAHVPASCCRRTSAHGGTTGCLQARFYWLPCLHGVAVAATLTHAVRTPAFL
jgi:hypothetical protein